MQHQLRLIVAVATLLACLLLAAAFAGRGQAAIAKSAGKKWKAAVTLAPSTCQPQRKGGKNSCGQQPQNDHKR